MRTDVNVEGTKGKSVTEGLPGGFTYFLRDGDAIKIGYSEKPKARISTLQTGSARTFEVLAVVPSFIAEEYETQQKFLHLRIRRDREWFRAEPELLNFIAALPGKKQLAPPQQADMTTRAGIASEILGLIRREKNPEQKMRLGHLRQMVLNKISGKIVEDVMLKIQQNRC
jgi:hypothetical protein